MPQGTFAIDGSLPGLNEIVNVARNNRFAGASQKKKETQRCGLAVIAGGVSTFSGPVTVTFTWIEKDLRRDPDNICAGTKFVLDSLVELGRIPGDGRRWIKGISHYFPPPDKKAPRILVRIELWT